MPRAEGPFAPPAPMADTAARKLPRVMTLDFGLEDLPAFRAVAEPAGCRHDGFVEMKPRARRVATGPTGSGGAKGG